MQSNHLGSLQERAMSYPAALSSRRMAIWQRSGTSLGFIDWLRQQWEEYDRVNGISILDRAFNLHQERFTAWLEQQQGGQQ